MIKHFRHISPALLVGIFIVSFLMMSYTGLNRTRLSHEMLLIECNMQRNSLLALIDTLDNTEFDKKSGDTSQQSGDDTSGSDEDLISLYHFIPKNRVFILNKKNRCILSNRHVAPHIDFLSPPPEA